MNSTAFLIILVSVFLLNGCVNLKPQADKTSLYTLGMNTSPVQSANSSSKTYYITRPELPSYLQGSKMFIRRESGEIDSLSGARWGEDLGEGIARALGEYIQASGKVFVRSQYPWPKLSRDNSDIRVLFKRFGAMENGQVEVVAVWQIRNPKGLVKEGTYQSENLSWDVSAPDTYVAQLNVALDELAETIVSEL